jgi:hypothetical protein
VTVPAALFVCFLAPLGLIVAVVVGFDSRFPGFPGWVRWGPWDGRLVYMALMAGLAVLIVMGRRLEKRHSVSDGGDGTPWVPSVRVVAPDLSPTSAWNRLIGCLATIPWKQLIGPTLLVIGGAGLLYLGVVGVAVIGALDA